MSLSLFNQGKLKWLKIKRRILSLLGTIFFYTKESNIGVRNHINQTQVGTIFTFSRPLQVRRLNLIVHLLRQSFLKRRIKRRLLYQKRIIWTKWTIFRKNYHN